MSLAWWWYADVLGRWMPNEAMKLFNWQLSNFLRWSVKTYPGQMKQEIQLSNRVVPPVVTVMS